MPAPATDARLKNKLLSLLRQKADQLPALFFDSYGFTPLDRLVDYLRTLKGLAAVTREEIIQVILHDQQGQFEWEGSLVRATFGFSPGRAYRGKEQVPPAKLFHGTHRRLLGQIGAVGIVPIASDVVQLAVDAESIGQPDITWRLLTIHAQAAYQTGIRFYRAGEQWYFCEAIPADFIELP